MSKLYKELQKASQISTGLIWDTYHLDGAYLKVLNVEEKRNVYHLILKELKREKNRIEGFPKILEIFTDDFLAYKTKEMKGIPSMIL